MSKAQQTGQEVSRPDKTANDPQKTSFIIHLINAIERCLRPPRRKRSITWKTRESKTDGVIEKEITYKDEY